MTINSITSAQNNLVNALIQREEIQEDLSKALKSLSKDPNLALMQILMILSSESGGTIGLAEDGLDQDSQEMNIMTDLANRVKDMTNDVNTISNPNSTAEQQTAAAKDLITQCDDLKATLKNTTLSWTNPITGKTETTSWISQSMATKATESVTSLFNLVNGKGGPQSVVDTITGWIKNPTTGNPTGQENIQSMNKQLAITGNLFQSLSTSAQNIVKEANTTLTQYQSNEGTLFNDFLALNKAIVNHLGGN